MDLDRITAETLEGLKDAFTKAATAGVNATTGLYGYDLGSLVSQVPVNTPTYDATPRENGDGSKNAAWRALLNVNSGQPGPFVGLDTGGYLINVSEQDVFAPYLPVRVSGEVTDDAIDLAKNYEDAKAIASVQTLMQWRIQDNKAIIGGQGWALHTISAQSTPTTATTGGTIALSTAVHVKVAARSALNYYWGASGLGQAAGGGVATADATVTTGGGTSTNTVTASWPALKGAVAYDVWVGPSSGTYFYYTTVTAPTCLITSLPVANQALPALPGLFQTAPTAVPYAADTTSSASSYNGMIASILGDYGSNSIVTPGSGTGSGATWTDLGGAALTGTAQGVTQIDSMLLAIFNAAQLTPTRIVTNARVAQEIGSASMGSNAAVTYLMPDGANRSGITVGVMASRYISRVTGETIAIDVDPWVPDGMAIFASDRIPYPNAGIANNFAVRCLRDVRQKDYGVALTQGGGVGPAEQWDTSSVETLVCRAPVTCGVLTAVG